MLKHILATLLVNTYILCNLILLAFSIYQATKISTGKDTWIGSLILPFLLLLKGIELCIVFGEYRNILLNQKFSCSIFLKKYENIYESFTLENKSIFLIHSKNYWLKLQIAISVAECLIPFAYFSMSISTITIIFVIYNAILFIPSIAVHLIIYHSNY